ncbi:MAG: IS21 family transposase [Planctomycetes bacterium]|nr:IS21 family transposase [Planctomycetota bacterium]
MPKARLTMRKIKEILRLKWECDLSQSKIAQSCGISRSTVSEYLKRSKAAGLSWPLPDDLSEVDLENQLYPIRSSDPKETSPTPDWAMIHKEVKKKGVTLLLLWVEFKREHPDGWQYAQFCANYRKWKSNLDLTMRQEHKAGEKCFVDYTGLSVPITNRETGEKKEAQIFVATLGASDYTYSEATLTQQLSDWIGSHEHTFHFLGGCPEVLVPDNLKSGVTDACRYEPDLNPTYQMFAEHYGIAVIPARVRKPQDKAKVEKNVQNVENWILGPLRNQTFFSLAELNQAIREGVENLNNRQFQKLDETRKSLFESLDQPVLKPLPATPFDYADWKRDRVGKDYHVELERHFYSVPHAYARRKVEIRYSEKTVEIYCQGKRIASHLRNRDTKKGFAIGCTTVREHMPKAHQAVLDWTPERLLEEAKRMGPSTSQLIEHVINTSAHPLQGARSSLGILRLKNTFGTERLERACERALLIHAFTYKSVRSILQKKIDHLPLSEPPPAPSPIQHNNIRGSKYYH